MADHNVFVVAEHVPMQCGTEREDFTAGDWPSEVVADIEETNNQLADQIVSAAETHHVNPIDMTLAAIDIPAAAARRAILTHADPAAEEHIRRRATEIVAQLILSN